MKIENAYDSVEVKYSGGTPLPVPGYYGKYPRMAFLDITGTSSWRTLFSIASIRHLTAIFTRIIKSMIKAWNIYTGGNFIFVFSSKLHLKIKGCSKKVEPWIFWECYEKKEKKKRPSNLH